jgi:hypothetical protein
MPVQDPHLQFQKWAKEYGPVFSLILGMKVMIVLSTDQAVKDLMDKKSAIYSSRPDMYISQTIMSSGQRMLITVCDARKFSTQILTGFVSHTDRSIDW